MLFLLLLLLLLMTMMLLLLGAYLRVRRWSRFSLVFSLSLKLLLLLLLLLLRLLLVFLETPLSLYALPFLFGRRCYLRNLGSRLVKRSTTRIEACKWRASRHTHPLRRELLSGDGIVLPLDKVFDGFLDGLLGKNTRNLPEFSFRLGGLGLL